MHVFLGKMHAVSHLENVEYLQLRVRSLAENGNAVVFVAIAPFFESSKEQKQPQRAVHAQPASVL